MTVQSFTLCVPVQRFHGEKELFDSDHADEIHKATIIGKAFVHNLKKYEVSARRCSHSTIEHATAQSAIATAQAL